MKKLFAVLFIAFLIQGCNIQGNQSGDAPNQDRRNGIKTFRTNAGVECIWKKEDLGLSGTAGGLSCNWEKWNKETNYRSIMR